MATKPSAIYKVLDNNVLGYVYSEEDTIFWVLQSSIIRGGPAGVYSLPVPIDKTRWRPATREDFADFRVSPVGHIND